MIQGGCFCGRIRYAAEEGEFLVVNCHCTMCRKTSAAPFVTWIIIPKSSFSFTAGNPKILQSSDQGRRQFCADCGTPLSFESISRNDVIDITVGSTDQPEKFQPTKAVHEESKLCWLLQTEAPNP